MNFLVFTSDNFKDRTQVCVDSIKKHHPDAKIYLEKIEDAKLGESYIPGMAKRRIETLLKLLEEDPNQYIMLLGADCVLYENIDFLERDYKAADIVIFPHVISPPNRDQGQLYLTGHANGDLILVSSYSKPILNWLVQQDMSNKINQGIFFEQTYLSVLPFIFDMVEICRDPAFNLAYYNIHERSVVVDKQQNVWVKKSIDIHYMPLCIAQFSGYTKGNPARMSKYNKYEDATEGTLKLFQDYENKLCAVQKQNEATKND